MSLLLLFPGASAGGPPAPSPRDGSIGGRSGYMISAKRQLGYKSK